MRIRRRTKRRIRRFLLFMPVLVLLGMLYVVLRNPSSATPANIQVDMSKANVERGRYLFTVLADCDGCHSQQDTTKLYAPVIASGRGAGRVMDLEGLPGKVVASNITPDAETGLGKWTDGEKIRAIREGIGKDGRALFPLMPYPYYRRMSDADVQAVVAYMNSLPAVLNRLPGTELPFLTRQLIKSEPQPVPNPIPQPDTGGGQVYGEYLANIAGCQECHTPSSARSNLDLSLAFAGGRLFATPGGKVTSANITPHVESGIGAWDFSAFRENMRKFRQYEQKGPPAATPENFTVMPYEAYSRLTDEDLEALFLYVKALKPVEHMVMTH